MTLKRNGDLRRRGCWTHGCLQDEDAGGERRGRCTQRLRGGLARGLGPLWLGRKANPKWVRLF
jgi:hypothetical protein